MSKWDNDITNELVNKISLFKSIGLKPSLLLVSEDVFKKLMDQIQIIGNPIKEENEYWNIEGNRVIIVKIIGQNICDFYAKELIK